MKISIFAKFCCAAAVFFVLHQTAVAKTASLGFQLGDVVVAEFTTAPVNILGKDESPVVPVYRSMSYAVVVIKLHKNRTVSQFDYSLTINGVKAVCVAVANNMDSFVSEPHNALADGKGYMRMLYVFDGARVRPGATVPGVMTLNFNATADRKHTVRFTITNIGSKNFTDVKNIPAAGLLK